MPGTPAATPAARSQPGRGLHVAPFRGVRFDPARVPDVATVTSPPYDVIDPDSATHLEQLDPHNVVRLILPREEADDARGRYQHAAARLAAWQAEGFLRRDDAAAMYVYEQARPPGMLQRGLLAAVELRHPDDRVVLPHEDVMPGPVADRLELMRATQANLEPILLVYDGGGGPTVGVIDATVVTTPLLETVTEDGIRHRLWALTGSAEQEIVARDLAARQALIADGHHRYATYRKHQSEQHDAGRGTGPWDRGLALLVDSSAYPLDVQAIHRVVEGLSLDEAVTMAATVFLVEAMGRDESAAIRALGAVAGHAFLLSDGESYTLLSEPDPGVLSAALPPTHSDLWRALDASVLHALLLERLWQVEDGDPRVRYLHDVGGALRAARRSGGTAVLMRPVTVGEVLQVAATGERMPRKSTSFGPKPRTGLVLRLLDE